VGVANVRSIPVEVGAEWQPSLLGTLERRVDLDRARRHALGNGAWVDEVAAAVGRPDEALETLLEHASWERRTVTMYDRLVDEPRLLAGFDGPHDPRLPPVAADLADALTRRYARAFVLVHASLYRDGRDSVAWHSDRIGRVVADPVVAILSLGSPRRFLMRPKGGGRSRLFVPHPGDLIVMGGTCQHTWEHHVPKCRHAGPRVSLMFRHAD
jgi:alkylated DNA repair dioxygenase AlkB